MAAEKANRNSRKRRRMQFFSSPVISNAGDAIAYNRALRGLCRPMVIDSGKAIIRLYRQYSQKIEEGADAAVAADAVAEAVALELGARWDVYSAKFSEDGEKLASAMVLGAAALALRSARDAATEAYAEVGGAAISGEMPTPATPKAFLDGFVPADGIIPPEISPVIKAAITENVNLIKSIPPQYLDRISGAVTRAMLSGGSITALTDEIRRYGRMTLRRATNIAMDQVHKAFEAVNLAEFRRLGITKFRWLHTGGSLHPREYHLATAPGGLNGGVFSVDDPPVIDKRTGERGFPGQLPFCRCTMCAVVEV